VGVENAFAGSGREFAGRNNAIAADAESALAQRSAGAVGELGVNDKDGVG